MKKKLFESAVSLLLCVCLIFSCAFSSSAAINIPGLLAGIFGGNSNINISQVFSEWLKGEIEEGEKESVIDKFVSHLKNQFNGTGSDTPGDDTDDSVTLDKGEAANIAELFNLTVNELKVGKPAFVKNQTASMGSKIASALQGGLGPITGLVESLIGTKDIFAAAIDGSTGNNSSEIRTRYPAGNDVINNLPVAGKNYVAALTADDIKNYAITIYKSGAYSIHIDLNDVEGSASASGLSRVFDFGSSTLADADKTYLTLNIGTMSFNVNVMLKYVDNYVECEVNRSGQITSYMMSMGITFLFQQEDGSYSSKIPVFGIDFAEEGIVYRITTEFGGFDFNLRKMGDANNDGRVNSSDARLVLRMASELEVCSEEDAKYCDVTLDSKVTASDARAILRASAKAGTLPSTAEALGLEEYKKSPSTQKHVDDLLILIMAYQTARDEAEQKKLQDAYDEKYNESQQKPEEPTPDIPSIGDKIDDAIDGIGGIIGGILGRK